MNKASHRSELLLATGAQSRKTDQLTIESLGIPGDTLMEIAGNKAASQLSSEIPPGTPLLFLCGKGNNAGDGFVIARILLNLGYPVLLYPVFGTENLSPDARRNLDRLMHLSSLMGVDLPVWSSCNTPDQYDIVIDALFGTGLERPVTSPIREVIEKINASGKKIYSLDVPSGLNSDSGEIMGTAIRASKTLQFGIRKRGCYMGSGPFYCGEREFLSLPFPDVFKEDISFRLPDETTDPLQILNSPSFRSQEEEKSPSLHKYSNGVVHVIGGSSGLLGAPLYTARAAWSLGMGALFLIHPGAGLAAIEAQAPAIIKRPIGGGHASCFIETHADEVLSHLSEKQGVIVIGPGMGRDKQSIKFALRVIRESEGPLVIDADALRALAENPDALRKRAARDGVILTPHPGELSCLTKKEIKSDAARLKETIGLAEDLGVVILSKGNPVFLHSPSKKEGICTQYDTSIFSRAGFGDTLSGHIAAFLSRTQDPFLSGENALLYGYQKILQSKAQGKIFPEPSDVI